MAAVGIIALFVAIGVGVIFVAYSGGPGRAREAYLTGGRRGFKVAIPLIYIALGIAVPALVIADRDDEAAGGTDQLRAVDASGRVKEGKELFRQTCASCHNLDAINARGVTGPDLDEIGELSEERVLRAIRNGGTGRGQMPAGLLEGKSAREVAAFVAQAAGR
jgi:mono/diheme cytochrome c family protein